jgi:superfamily II DNA or RNA helicase
MSQLEALGRTVSRKIKDRGREYFQRNAVRVLFADEEFISARVSGSQEYEVDLERDKGDLIFSCDCPYFEGSLDVCKHVWATILEIEKQGFLQKMGSGPMRLLPVGSYGDAEDEDYASFDLEDEAELPRAVDSGKGRGKSPAPAAPAGWRQTLGRMSPEEVTEAKPPSWPAGREILYVLDCSGRYYGAALALQIDVRDRKKNGGWRKQRPLSLSHDMMSVLPDPADREILTRLLGVRRETWYQGPYESIYRFQPANLELRAILPLINDTGRLFFRTPDLDEPRPIRLEDTGAWELRIEVRPDEAGRQYEVCGTLHKAGKRLSLLQPEHIFRSGIFVMGETLAFYDGSLDWISFFRGEGSFFVPCAEAAQWLDTMLGMPAIPPLDLPEELRLEEVGASPRPIVRVRTKKEAWGAPYLLGEIFFDYLGHIINEAEVSTRVPLVSERRILLRDRQCEQMAAQRFEQAGFRRQSSYSGGTVWTISQSRLPSAVRDLVAAGWQVEAEGRLFRNPDTFKLHIASGIDWFELHGEAAFGSARVSIPRLLAALKRRENTILLDDGSYGMLPEDWLEKYGMLAELGTPQADHVRFRRNQAGLLDALLATRTEVSCDEVFDRLRSELQTFGGVTAADPAPGFRGSLRPYQREGLGWLHFLQQFGFGGCLADDMGLGKTIQVLALIEERRSLRHANSPADRPPPSLVVMPRSLVFNWRQEAERFTPALRILEHTGGERIRSHEHFEDYDVIFTTYGTLRRDAPFFKEKVFDCLILDEAQAIKNASTESAKAARLLRGRHRLALSGTPIENHLGELWSLFEFLNPGMLGSAAVFKLGKGSADRLDEAQRALLAHALRPFILRRTKAQVAQDLPAKVEQTLFCQLEPTQRALYDELRNHYRRALLKRIEQEGMEKSSIHILEALLRLRQAAIHPGLIDRARADEPSAKLDMLMPQLAEVLEEGHKALIFSQFTSMLGILRQRLEKAKIPFEYLDGQTRDRAAPVERFQNDSDSKLFLISLKAGGLGLNLTAAEYVYLLDPWWNPAVEAQAVDRTHRIGQTRSVFAYRLIAKDTVEEKVLALQDAKREIADALINQDNSLLRNLRREDLALLLS